MNLSDHRAIEYGAPELAEILNRCFEGYLVPFVLTAELFERRFRPEGLDTSASLILMDGDQPAGVCLIARQGWTSRVAAMAIAPNYRAKGIGKQMMLKVIEEARERGDHRMVLEVIEQNDPAIKLYQAVGMTIKRRLIGYRRPPSTGFAAQLVPIDPVAFVRKQAIECSDDLVWDFKPETLTLKLNSKAFALDDKAFALVSESSADRLIIWSIFVERDSRRQGLGRRLVDGLSARYSDYTLVFPIAVPDDLAPEFMKNLAFEIPQMSQLEMSLEFVESMPSQK